MECSQAREELGLKAISAMRSAGTEPTNLLDLQRADVVLALAKKSRPLEHIEAALRGLRANGVAYCIATASNRPRVTACIECAKMLDTLPLACINSGESDFEPPQHKPAPWVYLKAAASLSVSPPLCVGVEDSEGGVGAAVNAELGLVVGYVGATHITDKDAHAAKLLAGTRSESGKGADLVLENYQSFVPLIQTFRALVASGGWAAAREKLHAGEPDAALLKGTVGKVWLGQRGSRKPVYVDGKLSEEHRPMKALRKQRSSLAAGDD